MTHLMGYGSKLSTNEKLSKVDPPPSTARTALFSRPRNIAYFFRCLLFRHHEMLKKPSHLTLVDPHPPNIPSSFLRMPFVGILRPRMQSPLKRSVLVAVLVPHLCLPESPLPLYTP